MIARYILSLCLLSFAMPVAGVAATPTPQLDDLMTPDEISEELHLGPTAYPPLLEPRTPDEVLSESRVDVLREFPVVMVISKGSQTATVYHYGSRLRSFPISTGRERWERAKSGKVYFTTTPTGWFSPRRYIRHHFSTTWEAKMEYSIFFSGGVAVHATTPDHYRDLGRPASGGCVRMHKSDAEWFWDLSMSYRRANVPYFSRSGHLYKNRDGSIRRHRGNGTLFIVTSH